MTTAPESREPLLPAKTLAKIHDATFLALIVGVLIFLILNVPGQINQGPDILTNGKYGPHWDLSEHCEHGWPLTYLRREPVYVNPWIYRLSLWRMTEGVQEFRPLSLLANVAVAASLLALAGVTCQRYGRRSHRFQVSLRGALLGVSGVAAVCGLYARQRAEHLEEHRVLQAIERLPGAVHWHGDVSSRVEWIRGGPSWLRQLLPDNSLRAFDRVGAIDVAGDELSHVARLRHVKTVRLAGGAVSNQELKCLEALPDLQALDLCFAYVAEQGDEGAGDDDPSCLELPRLPDLRGVNLYEASFRGAGLENVPQLELLEAWDTEIDDQALAKIGRLSKLKILSFSSFSGAGITDAGFQHLGSLQQLEDLSFAADITDGGLAHIAGLQRLRRLSLEDSPRVTDASIPMLMKLQNLEYLDVSGTQITVAGMGELQPALPNCGIYGSIDQEP